MRLPFRFDAFMSRLRLFVFWLAMFAIPLQGYAAATMALCGPANDGMAATMAMRAAEHIAPRAHDHDHDHDHADGHGHAEGTDAAHDQGHDAGGHDAGGHADAVHKCGSCAACHATGMTPSLSTVVLHDLPPADLAEPSLAMATRTPRVPDKPPRA